jgi:hypothetical protein
VCVCVCAYVRICVCAYDLCWNGTKSMTFEFVRVLDHDMCCVYVKQHRMEEKSNLYLGLVKNCMCACFACV